jgi:hypothetical protein
MATIGTITVEFAADLLGLQEGITEALDLFEELSDSIDSLSEQIEDASAGVIKIRAEMDKGSIAKAESDVKGVGKDAEPVKIEADTTALEQSASRLSGFIDSLRQSFSGLPDVTGEAAGQTQRFADNAGAAAEAGEGLGNSLQRVADGYLLAATGQNAEEAKKYAASSFYAATAVGEVADAASSATSAVVGFTEAATLATSGNVTATSAIDKTIVALGRSYGAYGAVAGAITGTVRAMGGMAVVSAAMAGSTAAAAISLGTLAAAAVGGAASFVTYKAAMYGVSLLTSGLSDEARGYVEAVAAVGAASAAAVVGIRASSVAYGLVAPALFRSTSASQLLQNALQGLGVAAVQGATRAATLLGVLGRLLPAIELVAGAANKEISLTQYAALTARIVATSVAFGAAEGAISAWVAGTGLAAGAAGGAGTAVLGFAATLPTVVPLAIAAAVATGRYAHELEELSLKAQAIDQMASRFGSSTEEITKLRLAADNTGVGMGQLAKGQQAFYTSLSKIKAGQLNVENVREAKLAYDKLNISLDELKSLKPEEAFKEVAKRLSEVKDPAERTAIAFDLFGKQGAAILPALKELGELEQDFKRLGGTLTQINFDKFLQLETSFDRLKASSSNLNQVLMIPFVEMQKAFNNATADIRGGLAAALQPVMTVLMDMTKPLAVIIEVTARVVNMMLRLVGAILKVAGAGLVFATIATLADMVGKVILDLFGYIEAVITAVEGGASVIATAMLPAVESFMYLGEVVVGLIGIFTGDIFGDTEGNANSTATAIIALGGAYFAATFSTQIFAIAMKSTAVQAVVSAAATATAWVAAIAVGIIPVIAAGIIAIGAYAASVIAAAATTAAAAVVMAISWLIALGPIGLIILGVAAIGAGLATLYALGGSIASFFTGFSDGSEKINAATASVEELSAAAAKNSQSGLQKDMAAATSSGEGESETVQVDFGGASRTATAEFGGARTAVVEYGAAMGLTKEQADALFNATATGAGVITNAILPSLDNAVVSVGAAFGMSEESSREAFAGMQEDAAAFASDGAAMAADGAYALAAAFGVTEDDINGAIQSMKEQFADLTESMKGPSVDEIAASVTTARDRMGELTIESAKFGQAGADAAAASQKQFNDLQQQLADGSITLEEFDTEAARLGDNLEKNLDILKNDAPEVTLKKNLELYKQLDDAAKAAGKSVRDIGAGVVIDDKFFPTSAAIKEKAAQYKNEYVKALEEIKKKQQSGGFAAEIKQKQQKNQADFDSGKISQEQFLAVKLELDSTNAQEQASIAAEEVKREFDRKNKMDIELDMSFADGIRKSLDEAFLSPVQKFDKELKKIRDNKSLTPEEKQLAEVDLRKKTTESLVGKSAQAQLTDRKRDLNQAADAGLITGGKLDSELQKAADDFAKAVGVTQTPFESFSSSLNNITAQFGFAGQPIDEVREKLKGNADQLDLFDRAVKESRDNLLSSLGIEKTPQAIFDEQMKKIDEAANSKDPNKRISASQAEEARTAATRKRDEALGAGADVGGQLRDRQKKIEEAFGGGKDPAKLAVAQNKLDMDKRSAAGLDPTAAQSLKAGVDKVNDAFGVTGKSMAEIQKELSPQDFKEYQEAIQKNSDAVKASLGVEKSGADKIKESRDKLSAAVAGGVITQKEADKAIKAQKDSLLSSLGISKSPAQDFEDAVTKIQENASELSPEEFAKGMKEAKDKLLSALGIDKSPAQQTEDAMKKLREAFDKGQISATEFAKGSQKAKDTLLQSLGIPLNPVTQLKERMDNLKEAFSKGQISQEEFTRGQDEARRSMLPGGEEESPVKKFERDMKAVDDALKEGLIEGDDADLRKKNLQAQLQEDLKPSLDKVAPDRRGIEGSDTRSKGGVDTFFRILRGNDNPSLKAQLEVARNTKILAEAAKSPEARPVLVQLAAR